MKNYLLILLVLMLAAGCKKECEKENYGNVMFKNLTNQNLKVKVDNTIPRGCLSANNGNLSAGTECGAEVTGNLEHDVVIRTDSNAVYWDFKLSVGPCGDRTYEIQ